jgi:hypothetical protein
MTAPLMDKSKLVRGVGDLVKSYGTTNAYYERVTDQILALTDSYYLGLLPEKKDEKFEAGLKVIGYHEQYVKGWNKSIDELRNRIGGQDKLPAFADYEGALIPPPTKETKNETL